MNDGILSLRIQGWALLPSVVSDDLVERLRDELDRAYQVCRAAQELSGLAGETKGTVHHIPGLWLHGWDRPPSLDLLDMNPARSLIEAFFDNHPYILQSMGGNFNFPDASNYASAVHRDIRSYSNDRLMLNTLVTLDAMNPENGATWLMPGSHKLEEKPTDDVFFRSAVQIIATKGSILLWDSRVWHCAGRNSTDKPRRIVTPIFTKPFYKPGMDYARANASRLDLSDNLRQILGFNARVPKSLKEWYQPPEKRWYQPSQG